MSKRKPVNNLLDELSGLRKSDSKASKEQDSKASSKNVEKVKNTYYLSKETDNRLEMARVTLRGITGKKLSKSDILEAALKSALDELESRDENSYLAILLSK